MNTILAILAAFALVLAMIIPVVAFLKYAFNRWRQAPNMAQGVLYRALTFFSVVALAFNAAVVKEMLFAPGGFIIEPSWQLGLAFLISWMAFWSQRAVVYLTRIRRTVPV